MYLKLYNNLLQFQTMGTRIESFEPRLNAWITEEILKPGQAAGMDSFLPDGRHLHYTVIPYLDDSQTKILVLDVNLTGIPPTEIMLRKGEDPFLISANGEKGSPRLPRKISHI